MAEQVTRSVVSKKWPTVRSAAASWPLLLDNRRMTFRPPCTGTYAASRLVSK